MTLAAVDRLVHHATILEMNVIKNYRHNEALERKRGKGRPAGPRQRRSDAPPQSDRKTRLRVTAPAVIVVRLGDPPGLSGPYSLQRARSAMNNRGRNEVL